MKSEFIPKILAIDDDPAFLGLIASALANDQVEILTTTDPRAGLEIFRRARPRIVLVDLVMPEMSGMDVLRTIVTEDPAAEVVLITGNYSTDSAVEAIQNGACDYLSKPLNVEKLRTRVNALIADAEQRRKTLQLDSELADVYRFEGIIGRSPLMLDVF